MPPFMARATYKGTVLAESAETRVVEGNHYFPPAALSREHFSDSSTHTVCGWKGTASYYDVTVDGERIADAAWYYPDAKEKAKDIEGWVAFYKNKVDVQP